jgi:cytochrome P450
MMSLNPPAHARVRSLVSRSFAPQVVDQLRAKVARAATTLLEENCGGDVVDFVRDFAVPLPIRLMLELFGVSPEHMTKLKEWSTAIGRTLETVIDRDIMERANAATESFAALLKDLIEQRRDGAGDDMLSLLMRKDDTGAALSDDEVIANAILIFSAGHETTTNALANTLYLLTRQPELLATLRTTPALRRSALEECLRHESPVQMLARRAKEDVVVGDKTIRAGQRVVVLLGSANRDPAQFDAPDEVRLDRSPNAHIAFGQGIHYCLGSPMARLELEVALNLLIERTADIRLESDDIEWNDNVALRGPRALRLAMTFR